MVHILHLQGIEVGRATAPITLKDVTYPAGSLLVKCNQPYGRLAKTLLGKQVDPDPELSTYDDSAWTMSMMTHTTITPVADPAVLQVATEPVTDFAPVGKVEGGAGAVAYAVPDHGSPNMITLRYGLKNVKVRIAEAPFQAGGVTLPAGTFLVPSGAFNELKSLAGPLGLDTVALTAQPSVGSHEAGMPRVAMYSTWGSTQNVGWVRYTFEQYKVPYDLIYKERLQKGNLKAAYDVILIPDQTRTAKQLVDDIPKGKQPLAYTKTPQFKFLGAYGSSDDITGGMGTEGVAALQTFVNDGGLMVTLGNSSAFPPTYGMTPKIDSGATDGRFYGPGPIVQVDIEKPNDPIFYGYTSKTMPVRWANGPLFRMDADDNKENVLMRYPGGKDNVLSGLMREPDEIKSRAALVKEPVGQGEVVMFTTNPIWRWQTVGEYRLVFNTLLNYQNMK